MEVKEQTLIDESTSSTQKRRKKNTVRCWYGCVLLILYTLGWRGLTDIDDAATSSQHFEIYLLSWVGALKNLWFNLLIQVLGLKMFCKLFQLRNMIVSFQYCIKSFLRYFRMIFYALRLMFLKFFNAFNLQFVTTIKAALLNCLLQTDFLFSHSFF